jgi:hypothetical protein
VLHVPLDLPEFAQRRVSCNTWDIHIPSPSDSSFRGLLLLPADHIAQIDLPSISIKYTVHGVLMPATDLAGVRSPTALYASTALTSLSTKSQLLVCIEASLGV